MACVPSDKKFISVFAQFHDAVVFGAGYAGVAAALALAEGGRRVLLVDARGDVLWESGRAFQCETGEWTPEFGRLSDCMSRITGIAEPWFDGATAEVTAAELLRDAGVSFLYHAAPVGVERAGDALAAVTLATRSGLRRLAARQWIDATEGGRIARLLNPGLEPRRPRRKTLRIALQRLRWKNANVSSLGIVASGCRATWEPSGWANERIIRVDMPGGETRPLRAVLPALAAARREKACGISEAFVSHVSFEPYPVYGSGRAVKSPAANLALAVPGLSGAAVRTLVHRHHLGLSAAVELKRRPRCEAGAAFARRTVADPAAVASMTAEVVVAGLGTGGAVAALAAAREGADVLAVEPLSFAGGIGVGGGIFDYYWGCAGGLQNEIDTSVREVTLLFAGPQGWPRGFHPDAKRVVVEQLLHDAGVRVRYDATLFDVERKGAEVSAAWLATEAGPVRLAAKAWIDATGDGDLCARAGVPFRLGRSGDGNLHAYSQSCGCFGMDRGRLVPWLSNVDCGFVDPTDSEDMTRARLAGIHRYATPVVNATNRLAYIAPLIGLRQGRLIETDYVLTIDDLLERRRFDDAVGYTGCHYDNHADDYEFESADALFLAWCAGLWAARTACEIPYRTVLPKGLSNVWLACRAAGVSEEAAHSFRMQRDIQRIGEVCGIAAALALRRGTDSRSVPYRELRRALDRAGALTLSEEAPAGFRAGVKASDFILPDVDVGVSALRGKGFGPVLWRLYRAGPAGVEKDLRDLLTSGDADASWRVATLLAAWGRTVAERRLLDAIGRQETGPEYEAHLREPGRGMRRCVPRWRVATALLSLCGTKRALLVLARQAERRDMPPAARAGTALAVMDIVRRSALDAAQRSRVVRALEELEKPAEEAGESEWQAVFAVARARLALAMPPGAAAGRYLSDPRAIVRRAFESVLRHRNAKSPLGGSHR